MIRPFLTLTFISLGITSAAEIPLTPLWSSGNPTDEEQYYLELLNRARANPEAEGLRIANTTDANIRGQLNGHNVNLEMFKTEMKTIGAAGPLAMNPLLLTAARAQSEYQFGQGKEIHVDALGRGVFERVAAAGYVSMNPYYPGENAFVSSLYTQFGHASFEVDWGVNGTTGLIRGGMQDPRRHREIAHAGWREVGIGIYNGSKTVGGNIIGPQVITQIFAIPAGKPQQDSPTPFVVGVASFDLNGNGFYDPGEGIGGITVEVPGAAWHAVTSSSGGYALPVVLPVLPFAVNFSGLGFSEVKTATPSLIGPRSLKVDLTAAYAPPAVTGPLSPMVGVQNFYSVSPVKGATGYDWRVIRKGAAAAAAADNANDLTRVTTDTSPPYSVLSTTVKQQGTGAWHLAHPVNRTETITFKNTFLGRTNPSLRYQSSFKAASANQSALVQISTDGGGAWTTVETQTGSGGNGQSNFNQRNVSLASLAGREFLLRFAYTVSGAPFNNSTADSAGWFIDAVSFTDIDDIGIVTSLQPGWTQFAFVPASTGAWLLSARPVISGRKFAFGPATEVNTGTVAPVLTYPLWCAGIELASGLLPGTLANDPSGDHNEDGVPNLLAYALGVSPAAPAGHLVPRGAVEEETLVLHYPRDVSKTDITFGVQISSDLQTWRAPGQSGAPAGFTDTVLSTEGTIQQRRASVPAAPGRPLYLRLRVSKP